MSTSVNYPAQHPYRKDAKSFLTGMKKRQEYVKSLLDETTPSSIKKQIGGKIIRLNRRLENLKWGYWAVNPNGCDTYRSLTTY